MNEKARKAESLLEQMELERMRREEWFIVRQEEAENVRKAEVYSELSLLISFCQ